MKNDFLLILAFLISTTIAQAQDWVNITVNAKIGVKFPSMPEINDANGWKLYSATSDKYVIQVMYLRKPNYVESATEEMDLDKFYDSYIQGLLDSRGNPNLLYNKSISFDSQVGREISFERDYKGENGLDLVKVVKKVFFIDEVIYDFSIFELSNKISNDISQKFFESIRLIN